LGGSRLDDAIVGNFVVLNASGHAGGGLNHVVHPIEGWVGAIWGSVANLVSLLYMVGELCRVLGDADSDDLLACSIGNMEVHSERG
jgi:hypothetical protein